MSWNRHSVDTCINGGFSVSVMVCVNLFRKKRRVIVYKTTTTEVSILYALIEETQPVCVCVCLGMDGTEKETK